MFPQAAGVHSLLHASVCRPVSFMTCVLSFPHSLFPGQVKSGAVQVAARDILKHIATDIAVYITEEEAPTEAIGACSAWPTQQGFPHGAFLHAKSCVPSIMNGHCGARGYFT